MTIASFLLVGEAAPASLVISDWFIASGVSDQNGSDLQSTAVVSNPFSGTQQAQIGDSYAHTVHDFSWEGDTGYFHVDSNHHMAQLDGRIGAEGIVNFSISTDSLVTYSARYDYSWPSNVFGIASLGALVYDYTDDLSPIHQNLQGGNVGLDPPHGSLVINTSALLTGGHNFAFRYTTATDVFTPSSPGTFGTATADITITITPIPEPAALAPLIVVTLAIRRRSRNPRHQIR